MEGGVILRERTSRRNKQKTSKPPLKKSDPIYENIMKTIREIRGSDQGNIYLAIKNNPLSNSVFQDPKALAALEGIMLEENNWDDKHAAAVFTALFRHKSSVRLTPRQTILFELLLNYRDELMRDLDRTGSEGGEVLVDILAGKSNVYAELTAASMLKKAEITCDDLERLAKLLLIDGISDKTIEAYVRDFYENNLNEFAIHLAKRAADDEDVEELAVRIGKPMVFPILRNLKEECENPERLVRILGELREKFALPALKTLDTKNSESLKAAVVEAIAKIESA